MDVKRDIIVNNKFQRVKAFSRSRTRRATACVSSLRNRRQRFETDQQPFEYAVVTAQPNLDRNLPRTPTNDEQQYIVVPS